MAKIVSKPVEIVFDAISLEDTQKEGWEILVPTGQLLLTSPAQVDRNKYPEKSVVNILGNVHVQRALGKSLYSKLTALLDDGLIVVCAFSPLIYVRDYGRTDLLCPLGSRTGLKSCRMGCMVSLKD